MASHALDLLDKAYHAERYVTGRCVLIVYIEKLRELLHWTGPVKIMAFFVEPMILAFSQSSLFCVDANALRL